VKLAVDDSPAQDVPETLNLSEGTHRLVFTADGYVPATIPQTIVSGKRQILPVVLQRVAESAANTAKDNKPPAPDRDNKAPAKEPAKDSPKESPKEPAKERPEPPLLGSIAVDSVVPIDVFVKGRQVGTTPVTFQLPTGEQSIEYRYQGFQKSASYVIRKGETTRAIITFEIDLQVNAKPWAQVSLDGAQRRVLGQTPLNTRVPVGSVLLFQNPRFPDKKYVVTGRDKTVQVMFP
jgi:hypothetical protein